MKKTWIKYIAQVCPKQKIIKIKKQTYMSNNPKFLGRIAKSEFVETITFTEDIPIEEYTTYKEHFDSRALQSDDRFFSTEIKRTRHSIVVIKKLQEDTLSKYPKEPIEVIYIIK